MSAALGAQPENVANLVPKIQSAYHQKDFEGAGQNTLRRHSPTRAIRYDVTLSPVLCVTTSLSDEFHSLRRHSMSNLPPLGVL
jgi:hypothetical protein